MFQKQDLSVLDWWLFFILMGIPIVNIIVFFIILLSSNVNRTLKNMLWSQVLIFIIVIGLFLTVFSGLIPDIIDFIAQYIPVQ